MTAAAAFADVRKVYPTGLFGRTRVEAVRGITLDIPRGSVFGLLGPNRAGKTTLVKMLLGLTRPTAGAVTRLGEPLKDRSTLGRVGYMHENHAFPRYLSAPDLLRFYGGVGGIDAATLNERVPKLLDRVGLADRTREPIVGFSKGMTQRLGLAQALVNDPDLLVLDEPTEGLDLFGKQLLRDVVREFRTAGKTVLLVTHALAEVEELCDALAVVVQGKVAYRGKVAELLSDPKSKKPRSLEAGLRDVYQKGAE